MHFFSIISISSLIGKLEMPVMVFIVDDSLYYIKLYADIGHSSKQLLADS